MSLVISTSHNVFISTRWYLPFVGILSLMCMFCRSLFFLLYIFFWPLCCLFFLRFTDFDYPFGIFKLFFLNMHPSVVFLVFFSFVINSLSFDLRLISWHISLSTDPNHTQLLSYPIPHSWITQKEYLISIIIRWSAIDTFFV